MISYKTTVFAVLLGVCSAAPRASCAANFGDLQGEVLLDNSRVVVEKYVLQPGQSTGRRSHLGDQLLVFIKGGVLTSSATGRSTLWRDGRVVWSDANERNDDGVRNTGNSPVVMELVTLKPMRSPTVPVGKPKYRHLSYPNVAGEDLLENDQVIVQRFTLQPGQWEGVHAHHPDMLYIHIKGGQWAARTYKEPEHAEPDRNPDGTVGWMPTIGIDVGHESHNVGPEPIDLIWVTLKK